MLREATVLDADILKVSSFLNHMVDVELMEACGEELAERLQEEQATKVLTVEATGLLPAMFVGKALGLPVIFARKSRQIGVSDSYQASYKSQVKSSTSDVYVSTEYLTAGDRVIIIDDFLAGGTTADALIRICRMANARVVGCGFLIEKWSDAGRAFLSGYGLTLESLVTVQVENGLVKVLEGEADHRDRGGQCVVLHHEISGCRGTPAEGRRSTHGIGGATSHRSIIRFRRNMADMIVPPSSHPHGGGS